MHRLLPALLLVLLTAAPASATTMVELTEAELTYIADLIVEADVEAVDAEREDGANWIKTIVTLRLTRVLKGQAIEGDRVLVREWGGSIDGDVTEVSSAPVYTPGERVFVFLEPEERPDAMWRTLGMTQGKFTLIEEADTGRDVMLMVDSMNRRASLASSSIATPGPSTKGASASCGTSPSEGASPRSAASCPVGRLVVRSMLCSRSSIR